MMGTAPPHRNACGIWGETGSREENARFILTLYIASKLADLRSSNVASPALALQRNVEISKTDPQLPCP